MVQGAGGQPALIYDKMAQDPDVNGQNVYFHRHTATGWTAAANLLGISNTRSGPSLAWDSTEGYGIAVEDNSQLGYIHSALGTVWSSVDPVFGAGSGGWYPSLAMDPVFHEPAIAFYVCSPASGLTETGCPTDQNELRVTQRTGGNWQETLVDAEGGYLPQLAFFASGKKVVAYRQPLAKDPATGRAVPGAGVLKLAVER
jgi:hypothetical protein